MSAWNRLEMIPSIREARTLNCLSHLVTPPPPPLFFFWGSASSSQAWPWIPHLLIAPPWCWVYRTTSAAWLEFYFYFCFFFLFLYSIFLSCLPLCCWIKYPDTSSLEEKGFIWLVIHGPLWESDGRNSNQVFTSTIKSRGEWMNACRHESQTQNLLSELRVPCLRMVLPTLGTCSLN